MTPGVLAMPNLTCWTVWVNVETVAKTIRGILVPAVMITAFAIPLGGTRRFE